MPKGDRRDLIFLGGSKGDLTEMPQPIKDVFGVQLYQVQIGLTPESAKPFRGYGSGILELRENFDTDTYRAVYVVRFEEAVYVLHAFKKKSHKGAETPGPDLNVIDVRLKQAQQEHEKWLNTRK